MKVGLVTVPLYDRSLEDMLAYVKGLGVEAVEIGTGGFPGQGHCNREELLADKSKLKAFKDLFKKYDIEISALSTHGNAVHPDKEVAAKFHEDFERTCVLANELEIPMVITFSGCPGGSPEDKTPNWVTCPWPEDFLHILDYQWNDVLIPYWQKESEYAAKYGVNKIAFEMHPGFCVYNPETLMKLRNAVGPCLGANFDPSHLIWQGMDPVAVIRELGGDAIFHVHAKDTRLDKYNMAKNGALDTKSYADEAHRSWIFRSVGYGNDLLYWKDIISALRLVGYDYAISIEHEDSLMSQNEGLMKAVETLKSAIIFEPKMTETRWI